jgi:hypothetical protein
MSQINIYGFSNNDRERKQQQWRRPHDRVDDDHRTQPTKTSAAGLTPAVDTTSAAALAEHIIAFEVKIEQVDAILDTWKAALQKYDDESDSWKTDFANQLAVLSTRFNENKHTVLDGFASFRGQIASLEAWKSEAAMENNDAERDASAVVWKTGISNQLSAMNARLDEGSEQITNAFEVFKTHQSQRIDTSLVEWRMALKKYADETGSWRAGLADKLVVINTAITTEAARKMRESRIDTRLLGLRELNDSLRSDFLRLEDSFERQLADVHGKISQAEVTRVAVELYGGPFRKQQPMTLMTGYSVWHPYWKRAKIVSISVNTNVANCTISIIQTLANRQQRTLLVANSFPTTQGFPSPSFDLFSSETLEFVASVDHDAQFAMYCELNVIAWKD